MPHKPEGAHFRRQRTVELAKSSISGTRIVELLPDHIAASSLLRHRAAGVELMELWGFVVAETFGALI
jgi:hypothetical protein